MLFGLVRRGSQTIAKQRRELHEQVAELSTLLNRNVQLDARVRGAAARTTARNERFLRRISTDLHDGPGQDLGFALMRLETIAGRCQRAPADLETPGALQDDFRAGMRERVLALGGSFELRATPGHGTVIKANLPTRVPDVDDE